MNKRMLEESLTKIQNEKKYSFQWVVNEIKDMIDKNRDDDYLSIDLKQLGVDVLEFYNEELLKVNHE